MLAFIRSQTNVVERLLRHIETPAIVDLLVRIVQLDEVPACAGVLEVRVYLFCQGGSHVDGLACSGFRLSA